MEYGRYVYILIAVFFEIFVRELFERVEGCNILNEVAALPVADGDIFDTLFGSEERFYYSHGM